MIRAALAAVGVALLFGPTADSAWAQLGQRKTPTDAYYAGFVPFYDGDYRAALRIFQAESRGSIKTAQSRWIDSICYEAMCGECYFQMGVFDKALGHYTAALQIYKTFPDWMVNVEFRPLRTAGAGTYRQVPWGASARQPRLAKYDDTYPIRQGQVDMNDVFKRGGVVQRANLFPITPQEIVRATALAMRRRATLLGPASKYDPLSNELLAIMSRAIGPPNHWSEAWANLERGLAHIAGGKEGQAVAYLQRAILAGGEFDHPLTCIALLELGRLKLAEGDFAGAANFFDEATFAAVNYPDFGVLEEAFRYRALTHLMSNGKGFFAPLESASLWAKPKGLRQFRVSLLLSAAENDAVVGDSRRAAAMLDDARVTIGKRDMGAGWIGARRNYLSALVAFQQKRIAEGNIALAAAMDYMKHGSLWLFHIRLADDLYTAGNNFTARTAMDVFADLLRDPKPADWSFDPMEALAMLMTPHPLPLEHWFDAAMERKETLSAIEVADRAKRHRFHSSLEFGGRLETLRWILEAPADQLPQQAQLQRQDILSRYPAYDKLAQQARMIHTRLAKQPLVGDVAAGVREQGRELNELAAISAGQEAILREIALRREPAAMVFPPVRTAAELQKSLPDKHAAMVFFATSRRMYGFLLNNERFASWQVASLPTVVKQMQTMLREMGNYQANRELTVKDLAAAKWKDSARQVLETLLKGSPVDLAQSFDELVIVPDGPLWYLPFEALQVKVKKESVSLISRFRIRYAPTVSLAMSRGPSRTAGGNTAVVVGKLYPNSDEAVARAAFEQLAAVVPDASALKWPLPAAPAIYGSLFQRLVVLEDMPGSDQDPYGWALVPGERGKGGALLGDWLALPWGGPDVVVLPGFHTAAEDAMKRPHRGMPGNEMFLSTCGLMANGARTVLLSRWRTGGQTSFDLVREFTQELSRMSPPEAWQRAVMLTISSRLNLAAEPRVKRVSTDEAPKGIHPFFWAGYMLIDCGTSPEQAESKADEPVIKLKQPLAPAKGAKPTAPEAPSAAGK